MIKLSKTPEIKTYDPDLRNALEIVETHSLYRSRGDNIKTVKFRLLCTVLPNLL